VDVAEATQLLLAELRPIRERSYIELCRLVDSAPAPMERRGASGAVYQLEVQVFWDSSRGGPVRVLGSIDDGGVRSLKPLPLDFIMAPDGSFLGE
jgi:hypothetical protein